VCHKNAVKVSAHICGLGFAVVPAVPVPSVAALLTFLGAELPEPRSGLFRPSEGVEKSPQRPQLVGMWLGSRYLSQEPRPTLGFGSSMFGFLDRAFYSM